MSRPDPHQIRRKPMARGAAAFAIREAHPRTGASRPLFVEDRLDIYLLNLLLDAAEVIVEGARYGDKIGPALFSGTALIDLDLAAVPLHPCTPIAARRLARALQTDHRAAPILEARAAAAMSRLLADRSPAAWQCAFRARAEGLRVRIDVEMEADLVEGRALG